jgi:hypothetical protein
MDFTIYDIAACITFFLLYAAIAVVIGVAFHTRLEDRDDERVSETNPITYYENTRLMYVYKEEISTFFALVWPIVVIFLLSIDLGDSIYTNFIYNGNEEDRIASWLF